MLTNKSSNQAPFIMVQTEKLEDTPHGTNDLSQSKEKEKELEPPLNENGDQNLEEDPQLTKKESQLQTLMKNLI